MLNTVAQHKLQERFTFHSKALPKNCQCKIVRFTGNEGLNTQYSFTISLVSDTILPLDTLFTNVCTLAISCEHGSPILFHGFALDIVQGSHINGWTFYTLDLVPQFYALTAIVQNAIYLDKNVQDIVTEAMSHCGLVQPIYTFDLHGSYPKHEFSMQHNEHIYTYLAFLLEREGIYYYFEQMHDREKLIFTDSPMHHAPLPNTPVLRYSPSSGLEVGHEEEIVVSFTMQRKRLVKEVYLRDYDWKNPNLTLEASATVDAHGLGSLFFYGEGFDTVEEGTRLATIRAESLRCRQRLFTGTSSAPTVRSGYTFTLENHYDKSFNTAYLITGVVHEGSQEAYLSSVLGITLEHPTNSMFYRNTFTCIPADVQFRPVRKTERKKMTGMLHGFIDSASNAVTPEIDGYGRYKVVFPQDVSGRSSGKASCWIRRAQPSVGMVHGTLFPLAPGVEVLIGFIGGDPDKPFISSAIPNAETGSVENAASSLLTGITTAGGGGLTFSNEQERQGFSLTTGSGRAGIYAGASGDDASTLFQSAYNTGITTSLDSKLTGLAALSMSGISSSLMAGGSTAFTYALAALKGISAVTTALGDHAAEGEHSSVKIGFDSTNALLKAATTFTALGQSFDTKDLIKSSAPYGSALFGSKEKSLVSVGVEFTKTKKAFFLSTQIAMILAGVTDATVSTGAGADDIKDTNVASQKAIEDINAAITQVSAENYRQSPEYFECQEYTTTMFTKAIADYLDAYHYPSMQQYIESDPQATKLQAYLKLQGFPNTEPYLSANEAGQLVGFNTAAYIEYMCTDILLETLNTQLADAEKAPAAKKTTVASNLATSSAALIAEVITVAVLWKQFNHAQNIGGVLLASPDKNVAIAAKTNTYMGAGMGVTIMSVPSADTCAFYKNQAALCSLHGMSSSDVAGGVTGAVSSAVAGASASTSAKPSLNMERGKTYIVSESEQIRQVAYKDSQYMSLQNTTIHAGSSIHITNKFTADAKPLAPANATTFQSQYEELFAVMPVRSPEIKTPKPPKGVDLSTVRTIDMLKADVVALTTQANTATTYSEIIFENDAANKHMKLENKGALLSLKHIPENATATNRVELLRRNEADAADIGKILLQGDKVEISFSSDGTQANARTVSLDADGIVIKNSTSSTLSLKKDNFELTHTDENTATSSIKAANDAINITSTKKIITTSDAEIVHTAKKTLNLSGKTGTVIKGGDTTMKLNNGSCSLTGKMIQIG